MVLDAGRTRQLLKSFDFEKLFIEELGWDHHVQTLQVQLDSHILNLNAIAQKRGMVAFICSSIADGYILDYPARRKIEHQVAKSVHEHLIVFINAERTTQIWQWVKREPGKPAVCRERSYHSHQPGDAIIQKLASIAFTLEEEDGLTIVDVAGRTRAAFDVDRITKRFYERFKTEHDAFLRFLQGIPNEEMQRWYASVMINRLMFIYFIQKKGFLDGDSDYLRNKLAQSKSRGEDLYYPDFLCPLFFEGFAKKEDDRTAQSRQLLGNVPYLNGGIFQLHQVEELHGKTIEIPDTAFQELFDFFDQYHWHLDERPLRADNEINPDVLGYIFEKYINQKQMGGYYTREDITGYISQNTVIPRVFDMAKPKCRIAFEGEHSIWQLLRGEPDRYIYDAVKKGVDLPLPEEIAAGFDDVSKRDNWNRPAPDEFALPTEIWREVVARRKRYEEVWSKLVDGEVCEINDLITYNLNIRQFAQDVIENCEGPELLRAFWHTIGQVTILDPTCGSGAFLFAALNILEPIYEACLDRMEVFLDELEHSEEKHNPEKFSDFRQILAEVAKHPNERYFILKSIILNNLFGVDIMSEAVEICKLRLFLKLVAQVERVDDIEPLPDIDFNIRAGNALVGFTNREEIQRAMTMTQKAQMKMLSSEDIETMRRVEEKALGVDQLFSVFRQMQIQYGMDSREFTKAKRELRRQVGDLENELNVYLATEYGVVPRGEGARGISLEYRNWLESHKPFHWFVDYYGIMKDGGFDVTIGNPPYLHLKDMKEYTLKGYATIGTRNLYSVVLERCQSFAAPNGHQGYIVPVSSVATEGYLSLQKILSRKRLIYSSYDDRPAHLFHGLDKNTVSILLMAYSEGTQPRHSTRLCRWNSDERADLFSLLQYHEPPDTALVGCMPKIGSPIEANIWQKLFDKKDILAGSYVSHSEAVTYYSRKINAFLQILDFIPEVHDGRGAPRKPSEFKELRFPSVEYATATYCCLNSSLFRWFLDVTTDGSHLNRRELDNLPFDPASAISRFPELLSIAAELTEDLKRWSEYRVMRYEHDTLTIQCIIPKYSKNIIDRIDQVLAKYYGFTQEELDFVVNYDMKYRMGAGALDDEE